MHRLYLLAFCLLVGCESSRHFTFLGYTTRPNYSESIRTIYVPMFGNQIALDTTRRNIEVDVTRAVIREIESKTPYKVVSHREGADTELTGTIMTLNKNILNRNQLNEIREADEVLTVGLIWRDLRNGEILSQPKKGQSILPTPGIPALDIPDPSVPALPSAPIPVLPPSPMVMVTGVGNYIPEIGQGNVTAYQQAINKIAVQIVSQMEKPW